MYSKIEYLKERKIKGDEYVNYHFSVGNNTRGSTYSNNEDGQHNDDDKREEKWLTRIQ